MKLDWARIRKNTLQVVARIRLWTRTHVPFGLRLPLGILLIIGGFFAILPVFGLWMIPVGIAVAALDVGPMLRWLRARRLPRTVPQEFDRSAQKKDADRVDL